MNVEQARFNMIEQQIRTWEVLDTTVLDLLFEVKRETFVPPAHASLAFADLEIPLGHGETMLQPTVPAIVNDLASDRDRGRFNAVSAGSFQVGAITAPIVAGWLLDRHLSGLFIAVIVAGLGGVAVLALALERQITPEVNGILDER